MTVPQNGDMEAGQRNHRIYSSETLAQQYVKEEELQPAEAKIRDLLLPTIHKMHMLDIGVGGGRTTIHFAPLVHEYTGIDYSDAMVEACKSKFAQRGWVIQNGDARDLRSHRTESYDLVLFSYNGLDYISHLDRIRALREIFRVLKRGGFFAFSTHNLYALESRLKTVPKGKLRHVLGNLRWKLRYLWMNSGSIPSTSDSHIFVKDGALGFKLETYYVRPELLAPCLHEIGFGQVRLFQMSQTEEVDVGQLRTNPEDWFYVLCKKQ